MKRGQLPDVCSVCRKLKLPELGEYSPKYKYNSWKFVCFECQGKPTIRRLTRRNNETPPEREVRQWLQERKIPAVAEFTLKPFIYDFAFPRLWLLVELDSKKYHMTLRHRLRDARKTQNAVEHGWTIKRIRIGPHMLLDLERCLIEQHDING